MQFKTKRAYELQYPDNLSHEGALYTVMPNPLIDEDSDTIVVRLGYGRKVNRNAVLITRLSLRLNAHVNILA